MEWEGFPSFFNTWEPYNTLSRTATVEIGQFERRLLLQQQNEQNKHEQKEDKQRNSANFKTKKAEARQLPLQQQRKRPRKTAPLNHKLQGTKATTTPAMLADKLARLAQLKQLLARERELREQQHCETQEEAQQLEEEEPEGPPGGEALPYSI